MNVLSVNRNTNTAATLVVALAASNLLASCANQSSPSPSADETETWSVTAWGERYEIFPEVDPLVAGEVAMAHTHVTVLEDFSAMSDGSVEIRLRSAGAEQSFRAEQTIRPGIFNVEIRPEIAGDFDLAFLIRSPAGTEEIPGGRVRVGTAEDPGSVIADPALPGARASDGGEIAFLKEEQWRGDFATAWVNLGQLHQSVEGLARVRAPAGGEATIASPVDAVLLADPWPYPGRRIRRGAPLFRMVPRVAVDRSLATLQAERNSLSSELTTSQARHERLRGLFAIEATSRRELEEAETRVHSLSESLQAAELDLDAARTARQGGSSGATTIFAPFAGEIATVFASPGEVVTAGAALARLVRTDSVWLEVAVSPEAGRRLAAGVSGVVVRFPEGSSLRIERGVRLVAIAPEVDSRTGTVAALLEVPPSADLILGTTAMAQVLLADTAVGVVIPNGALVDDGGVSVVYLQLSGESFGRQPVRVTARQGELAMVEGLVVGQRLVTQGGRVDPALFADGHGRGPGSRSLRTLTLRTLRTQS